MDELRTELDRLEENRLEYVKARSRTANVAQALREAGINKATYYHSWSAEERERLEALAQRVKREAAFRALMVIQESAEDAARVMFSLLKSKNDNVKQRAAADILDRVINKAVQPVDVRKIPDEMTDDEVLAELSKLRDGQSSEAPGD